MINGESFYTDEQRGEIIAVAKSLKERKQDDFDTEVAETTDIKIIDEIINSLQKRAGTFPQESFDIEKDKRVKLLLEKYGFEFMASRIIDPDKREADRNTLQRNDTEDIRNLTALKEYILSKQ